MSDLPNTLEPHFLGMPRCRETKRPAFATVKDMDRYFSHPRAVITHKWQCNSCNHWHSLGYAHDQFNRYNFAEKAMSKRNDTAHAGYVSRGLVIK